MSWDSCNSCRCGVVQCSAVQCSGLYLLLSLVLCAAFISPYRERCPPFNDFYLNAFILLKMYNAPLFDVMSAATESTLSYVDNDLLLFTWFSCDPDS